MHEESNIRQCEYFGFYNSFLISLLLMCPKYEKNQLTNIFLNKRKVIHTKKMVKFIKNIKEKTLNQKTTQRERQNQQNHQNSNQKQNDSKKINLFQPLSLMNDLQQKTIQRSNHDNCQNLENLKQNSQSQPQIIKVQSQQQIQISSQSNQQLNSVISIQSSNQIQINRKKFQSSESDIVDQSSEFMKCFLKELMSQTEKIKGAYKKSLKFPEGQKFKPISQHQCPFCPRTFQKPCSLGGHISKLHAGQKKLLKEEHLKTLKNSQIKNKESFLG